MREYLNNLDRDAESFTHHDKYIVHERWRALELERIYILRYHDLIEIVIYATGEIEDYRIDKTDVYLIIASLLYLRSEYHNHMTFETFITNMFP